MAQQSVHQLYQRLETVGKGAYGSVHKGVHIPTGNVVALKIINLDTADDDVGDIQREVALLTQLRDAPNVTKYYGCYMDGPRVWIVMEFAQGGSVLQLMKASKDGCIEERYVAVIIREVLIGLAYLHKSSVIHRDIKAANVLVATSGKVMICDFGVSALLATASSKRNTLTGTPYWMAPEVLQAIPAYDTKADIWSLGIMIFEIIKGSPPHSNLTKFKVMDLIPRAKAPRLQEGEASKDLRDFVALCLKEVPTERLPAEELSKTKWIKTFSKVSVTTLKELILRHDSFIQRSGRRASLAEPLPWEEDEENDLQHLDVKDENPWEFETVRGRRPLSAIHNDDDSMPEKMTEDISEAQATVRPLPSSALPSSLRLLFEDEAGTPPESFRVPAFVSTLEKDAASPPSSLPSSVTPSPARDRIAVKRAMTLDPASDELSNTKQSSNSTTSRPNTPRGRFKASPLPTSEDEGSSSTGPKLEGLPPLGPGIPRGGDSHALQSTRVAKSPQTYRDARSNRGPPDIDILPPSNPSQAVNPPISLQSLNAIPTTRPLMSRKRSQSSAEGLRSAEHPRDTSLSSTPFQFPPIPDDSSSIAPILGRQKTHNRISPTHASASSSITTPASAHQSTYSLDTSSSTVHSRPPRPPPPPMSRTRSATALPESAMFSLNKGLAFPLPSRQGSTTGLPLTAPTKPFARSGRDRSGSSESEGNTSNTSLGLPGLKDVLKVPSLTSEHQLVMSDLLPPSPSAFPHNTRGFIPSPSHLNTSTPPTGSHDISQQYPAFKEAVASASSTSFSLGLPISSSPPSNATSFLPPPSPKSGPTIQPLDYSKLMLSSQGTQSALIQTVDSLAQWLSVIEVGLAGLLDAEGVDRIEEEQEDLSMDLTVDDSLQSEDLGGTGTSHFISTPATTIDL